MPFIAREYSGVWAVSQRVVDLNTTIFQFGLVSNWSRQHVGQKMLKYWRERVNVFIHSQPKVYCPVVTCCSREINCKHLIAPLLVDHRGGYQQLSFFFLLIPHHSGFFQTPLPFLVPGDSCTIYGSFLRLCDLFTLVTQREVPCPPRCNPQERELRFLNC